MGFPNMNKATSSVSIPEREKINSLIHSLCIVILQIVRGMYGNDFQSGTI